MALLAALMAASSARGENATGCAMSGSRLVAEAAADVSGMDDSLVSVDPWDGDVRRLPVNDPVSVTPLAPAGFMIAGDAEGQDHLIHLETGRTVPVAGSVAAAVTTTRSLVSVFRSPRWATLWTPDADGLRLRIIDREGDRIVVDTVFRRRIEIAATATSDDGRFVAYLQANNVASELTLFDAAAGTRRDLRIPHDTVFAAYAMSLVFSPDGSCLAVSMDWEGRPPESWMIDPRRPGLVAAPVGEVFVLAWVAVPDQV